MSSGMGALWLPENALEKGLKKCSQNRHNWTKAEKSLCPNAFSAFFSKKVDGTKTVLFAMLLAREK